ncbi:MAG TPA: division/cell wall cluster transcriptional repressor MraZ [Planctomycetota bacterium]|nr:division/cell wall cluster transcriptional repressor MraZ [Planctomycetota bacterium]
MFVGEFRHTIDAKNRMVIPAKFRAFITDAEDRKGFFVMASPVTTEHCLRLYTMGGWRKLANTLRLKADEAKDPARYMRFFASRGEFSGIDAQSRVVIPQKLMGYAGLQKEVLMVGNYDWIEVWNVEEYRAATESLDEEIQDRSRAIWPKPE